MLKQIVKPLLSWYDGHARVLPWRENRHPYRVWVSEIMLQQTRVEAVKPFFERFIKALPDVKSLAECPEDELLKLWEGLGYYNRVRNMQKAAQTVMEQYDGAFPADYEKLLSLPGIGHYTAGAIASIAYGKPVPAVDGNALRVLSRVTGDDSDIAKQSVRSNMETVLAQVIPKDRAKAFNQALMELGATVCLPNGEPKCGECPWKGLCVAKAENQTKRLPVKSRPKKRKIEKRTVFLIRDGEKVILRKRPQEGLLAGMYEFPNTLGSFTSEEALSFVKQMNLTPLRVEPLDAAKHIFSHVEWQMKGYLVRVEALEEGESDLLFAEAADFKENYPMPSAFAAYAKYLNICHGKNRFGEGQE